MRQTTVVVLTLLSILGHERSATDAFSSSASSIHNNNISAKNLPQQRSTRIRRRDERCPSTSSLPMMFQIGTSVHGRDGRPGRRHGSIISNRSSYLNCPSLYQQRTPKYNNNLLPSSILHSNTYLHQSKDPNNNEDESKQSNLKEGDNNEPSSNDKEPAFFTFLDLYKVRLISALPTKLVVILSTLQTRLGNFLPTLRVAVTSFVVGIALTLTLVLVPVYDSVDKMTEPVTLFETILADLDRGYVDKVDTKKLFETGVNAMLRSLDPYTEFEGKQEAADLTESVSGRYGGIGLVISGTKGSTLEQAGVVKEVVGDSSTSGGRGLLPQDALDDQARLSQDEDDDLLGEDMDEDMIRERKEKKKYLKKAREQGIRVISAMEGYAFDYGMRPGDKIVAVDDKRITPDVSVENVRNLLRGEPGSKVAITIQRVGVEGENIIEMPRTMVQMRDVKLTTLLGNPRDGIGYTQLTGFTANSGSEVRNSIFALQKAAEAASEDGNLNGLILDLRGNPGGLLTSAVEVSSLFVPQGTEIVSARGRGFPSVRYISRVEPIVDSTTTKVAVLINGGTASAAEIVSGAIQDLDVGVIVGSERTYGKGLVQNVADLPFDTALKFTVAKYYTPSGRCIQSTNYKAGELSTKVKDQDKTVFYTANGREVKDGGGIAADLKVDPPQASALEVTLLRSGSMNDFAAEWSKNNQLTDSFMVDGRTYKDFQNFVMEKQKVGDLKLDALYSGPIDQLKKSLKDSGYNIASKEVKLLEERILSEMKGDFQKYSEDIKEDIGQSILSRYMPDSMLRERSLKTDTQVIAAIKLVSNDMQYNKLLGRTNQNPLPESVHTTLALRKDNLSGAGASIVVDSEDDSAVKLNLKF